MVVDVPFSLNAGAELIRIVTVVGSAAVVLNAAHNIRRKLENVPADQGAFFSEGLCYSDEDPLRAFFVIDAESMIVEVTDFRIL